MFSLDKEQQEKITDWWSKHKCSARYSGAIGGGLTYKFTPTSLGIVIKVQCGFPDCNEVLDVSDYHIW